MGKKSAVSLLGGSKPSTKTLAAKQVVRVVGGWGISKREWERSEKKGLDLQASEKAREKVGGQKKKVRGQKKRVGGQKKRVGGQKKGVVGQKKGVWVRKKGLWVKKKGIPFLMPFPSLGPVEEKEIFGRKVWDFDEKLNVTQSALQKADARYGRRSHWKPWSTVVIESDVDL